MMQHIQFGRQGEEVAVDFLREKGYRILYQNWRAKPAEIDIIACTPEKNIAFVEVKTRKATQYGAPIQSIHSAKLRNLSFAMEQFASQHPGEYEMQIDLVWVLGEGKDQKVTWTPSAVDITEL